MSLSGISFSGVGSGIDSATIISQLMGLERIPVRRMQIRQAQIQARSDLYGQFRSKLGALNAAASALNSAGAFNAMKVSLSDPSVALASVGSGAAPGSYQLKVSALAQAHKVGSTAQASADQALGYAGEFMVNGKAVSIAATDSLNTIAGKLNTLGAGVTASVVNGGAGNAFLSLTSDKTGVASAIQLAQISGNALSGLGLQTGGAALREDTGPDRWRSFGFSGQLETLKSLTGSSMAGTFTINGQDVAVDFETDTLQGLASKINALGAGVTASVAQATEDGKTVYRLQVDGAGAVAGTSDPDGVLQALGVFQRGFSEVIVGAQDAAYSIDGVNLTSASNSVSGVVSGVTLTLLKADSGTPPTTTLTISRDDPAIKGSVKNFMSAYNDVVGFIRSNSSFDKDTFASGPLFGDAMAAQVTNAIGDLIFKDVGSGSFRNLTSLGFSIDGEGKMTLDESRLDSAIAQSPNAVAALFRTVATTNNTDLSYISSTSKSKPSGPAGYEVNITQLATKTSTVAQSAQTGASTATEKLTFSGTLFGGSSIELTVSTGSTAADLVDQINNDSRLRDLVQASLDGDGKLNLVSKRFGTPGAFSVVSDLEAGPNNSGFGTDGGVVTLGLNVEGTINGEEATGSGQFLTGKAGAANVDGLQILYAGNTLGAIGNVVFGKGVASRMSDLMMTFTDTVDGLLTATDRALQDQIKDITDRITDYEKTLEIREQTLRARFLAMEQAVSALQAQQARLNQMRTR
ncbi:MAG: flagellar filament capping protein FliD [Fimbriimonadaceae bacterium]|nr:MAG: flagellar filament capping protein FliD [Fimbriimonadaceae bacterium]